MLWKLWVHYWRQAVSHPWEIGWPHRHQGATVFHYLLNYTLLFGWLLWHEHFEEVDSCQLFPEVLQTQVQPFLPFASMNFGSNHVSLQAVLSKLPLFRSIGSGCQIDFDFGTIWIYRDWFTNWIWHFNQCLCQFVPDRWTKSAAEKRYWADQ